jgi:hypothetical protein
MTHDLHRREFLRRVGAGAVAGAIAPGMLRAQETQPARSAPVGTIKDLPTRRLGRIDIQVPLLSFGTAPMGHALYDQEPFEEVINAAVDAGIRYLDTARIYDVAEERLAPILAKQRDRVFLVTKVWTKTRDEALRILETSLTKLKVDHVDLCHLHNVGQFTTEEALGKDGLLDGLREAKKRGWIKHIGCSGHLMPERFIPVLETGEIDLLMCAMNFADHHTYNFEEKVLPTARKHDIAIVCMKVYGGVIGSWDGYKKRQPGRLVSNEHRQDAFDYALSIPGVATCVVGMKSLEELRLAIEAVRKHRPLEGKRRDAVLKKGARLAADWGPHFGPVA